MRQLIVSIIIVTNALIITAIPPPACFANFRGEDCGKEPQHVIYYWKPGSRCEVGIWRGCLPNVNMFKDQYECVSTCIFTVRAHPLDFHQMNVLDAEYEETTVETTLTTDSAVNGTGGTEAAGEGEAAGDEGDGGGDGDGDGDGGDGGDGAEDSGGEEDGGEPGAEGEADGEAAEGEEGDAPAEDEPPPEK